MCELQKSLAVRLDSGIGGELDRTLELLDKDGKLKLVECRVSVWVNEAEAGRGRSGEGRSELGREVVGIEQPVFTAAVTL